MQAVLNVIACEGCDALHQRATLAPGDIARCQRCGTELERHPGGLRQRMLPLTLASLIVFAIANVFPIVEIKLRGVASRTTLAGAVVALAGEGRSLVSLLVLATTILIPLLQLAALFYLLTPNPRNIPPPGYNWLARWIQSVRPWGMIEVFLLGVLVAIVKLSSMAIVVPGIALWAFVALTFLLATVLSFDLRSLWDAPAVPRQLAE